MGSVKDQEPESEEASEEEFSEEEVEEVDDPEGTVHNEADEIEEQESKSEELPSRVPEHINNDNDGPDAPNGLKMEDLAIDEGAVERACDDDNEGLNRRQLSMSPPKSRRDLQQGGGEEGEERDENRRARRIKEIVSNDIAKMKEKEQRKYHSKKSVRNAGRPQGSKAKQDKRVKLSEHTDWT